MSRSREASRTRSTERPTSSYTNDRPPCACRAQGRATPNRRRVSREERVPSPTATSESRRHRGENTHGVRAIAYPRMRSTTQCGGCPRLAREKSAPSGKSGLLPADSARRREISVPNDVPIRGGPHVSSASHGENPLLSGACCACVRPCPHATRANSCCHTVRQLALEQSATRQGPTLDPFMN